MDIDELRRIAAKEELSLNYVAKDEMLSKLLVQLQIHNDIILKGGTAINRVYVAKKRFSEDIDCDLIFTGSVKQAIKRTDQIVAEIRHFSKAKPRIMKVTIRYDLFYINPLTHKDRIRLEFRPVTHPAAYSRKIVQYGYVPHETALINVYDIETMIQNKVDCILTRLEGKDFIDLYYLLDLSHKSIKLSQKVKNELMNRITLSESDLKAVVNVINHYIPRSNRPHWSLLLNELKEKIRKM